MREAILQPTPPVEAYLTPPTYVFNPDISRLWIPTFPWKWSKSPAAGDSGDGTAPDTGSGSGGGGHPRPPAGRGGGGHTGPPAGGGGGGHTGPPAGGGGGGHTGPPTGDPPPLASTVHARYIKQLDIFPYDNVSTGGTFNAAQGLTYKSPNLCYLASLVQILYPVLQYKLLSLDHIAGNKPLENISKELLSVWTRMRISTRPVGIDALASLISGEYPSFTRGTQQDFARLLNIFVQDFREEEFDVEVLYTQLPTDTCQETLIITNTQKIMLLPDMSFLQGLSILIKNPIQYMQYYECKKCGQNHTLSPPKLDSSVDLPPCLLFQYTRADFSTGATFTRHSDDRDYKTPLSFQIQRKKVHFTYDLTAAVLYTDAMKDGKTDQGHYTSISRSKYDGQWYKHDNITIKKLTEQGLADELKRVVVSLFIERVYIDRRE